MSASESDLICDAPSCDALATLECACTGCVRENRVGACADAFHACGDHRSMVDDQHNSVRGYGATWCGITAGSRPLNECAPKKGT